MKGMVKMETSTGLLLSCDNIISTCLAKAFVMFIDEPFYDDACLKKKLLVQHRIIQV